MRMTFTIEVELEKGSGKFASKDEIADKIMEDLESADPGTIFSDDNAEFNVVQWDVSRQ